ncbi:MAG: GreA/GreB family elongation factor, partial [Capnocytophaga gingivalis]
DKYGFDDLGVAFQSGGTAGEVALFLRNEDYHLDFVLGLLEMKIAKLEELVASARVIDESQLDTSKVLILSTVKLKNKANNAVMTYTLVAESEADLKTGKISVSSPIGRGLLGKSVGDIAEIKVPNGTLQMEIIEITR